MNNKFHNIKKFRTRISRFVIILIMLAFIFGEQKTLLGPTMIIVTDVIALLFVTIATLGRIWCSFYISGFKNKKVVSEGPYSTSRNPLYLYSLIGAIGISLVTHSLLIWSVVIIAFALYYPFVILGEERKLTEILGEEYQNYVQRVPRFLPKFKLFSQPKQYLVKPKVFYADLKDCSMFIIIYAFIVLINGLKANDIIPTLIPIF